MRRCCTLMLIALVFLPLTAYADTTAETNSIYRNAMYLYLRIAGVAWIGLEWIAAFILWRAYKRLRDAAKELPTDA